MKNKILKYFPAVFLVLIFLAVWQIFSILGLVSTNILPSPINVINALIENLDIISIHSLQTLLEAIIGLAIATFLGLLVAILLDMSSLFRKAAYPILVTSQT